MPARHDEHAKEVAVTEWVPATEAELAMRDALRASDQELYFRILARTELLLPVSADALAGRAAMGWGTWTSGDRTHVLAFTSPQAMAACLADHAGSARRVAYHELAQSWPNPDWWLAVNPGLPIEGYLPAWFVTQLARGDVRLPGKVATRARVERVESFQRARAVASVPTRAIGSAPAHAARAPAPTEGGVPAPARPEPNGQLGSPSAGAAAAPSEPLPRRVAASADAPVDLAGPLPRRSAPGGDAPAGPADPLPRRVAAPADTPNDLGDALPRRSVPGGDVPGGLADPLPRRAGRAGVPTGIAAASAGLAAARAGLAAPHAGWSPAPAPAQPPPEAAPTSPEAAPTSPAAPAALSSLAALSSPGDAAASPAAPASHRVAPLPAATSPPPAPPEAPAEPASWTADRGVEVSQSRADPDFRPANSVEENLLAAVEEGNTDQFLSTLLLAKVLVPVPAGAEHGTLVATVLEDQPYVVVFTSPERLADHRGEPGETVTMPFVHLIRNWPDPQWSFAVNPSTPIGAKLPGTQIVALASWADEVGLTGEPAADETAQPLEPAPRADPPRQPAPARPTVMQKVVPPSQVDYYLERGYDRVSGFVHRASEVDHLRTPAQLYSALGLSYAGSPFSRDAAELYLLRWAAHRPNLYRIPYGGQHEAGMRAMQGWVIERGPFRGNGFAPGDSGDIIAEFKVDSARLPHGAQLLRVTAEGTRTLVAVLDADGSQWRRVHPEEA
jgi:hypothetical protein